MAKTVLVVDDDSLVRRSLVTILRQNGYRALEATNGKEGFEKATEEEVNLIVTDLNMPEMSGIEMTEKLREHPKGKNLKIIILTTDENTTTINQAMEAGVTTYFSKSMFDLEGIGKQIIQTLS